MDSRELDRKVEKLLTLPWENEYQITKIPEEEGGGFSVSIAALGSDYCIGDGETIEEAIGNLRKSLARIFRELLAQGRDVPVPQARKHFSGTILLRATPDLHSRLMRAAEREGVSLNYFVGLSLERSLAGENLEKFAVECRRLLGQISGSVYRMTNISAPRSSTLKVISRANAQSSLH